MGSESFVRHAMCRCSAVPVTVPTEAMVAEVVAEAERITRGTTS